MQSRDQISLDFNHQMTEPLRSRTELTRVESTAHFFRRDGIFALRES
jgi:hypothetical protein